MVADRNAKLVFALVLLAAFVTAKAAPTPASSCRKTEAGGDTSANLAAQPVSPASNADSHSIGEVELFRSTADSALAKISDELLKPPNDSTILSALPPGTKALPSVPAALFMGLTGFLCVSLVRDRKVWLTGLTTLLWIVTSILDPRFSSHYGVVCRSRTSIEHPVSTQCGLRQSIKNLRLPIADCQLKIENRKSKIENVLEYAINKIFVFLIPALTCLPFEFRQLACFSPAFIFENLPRGPPTSL